MSLEEWIGKVTPLDEAAMATARLLCPWDFSDKKPGVGCHVLLQGIFSTQGLNP